DAIGGRLLALHRPLRGMGAGLNAELDEGPRVDQEVDPLAPRELSALVLERDLLLAAAELGLLAAPVEVLHQRLHTGLLAGLDLGRRLGRPGLLGGGGDLFPPPRA